MKHKNTFPRMASHGAMMAAALVLALSMAGCLSDSDGKSEPTAPGAGTGLLGAGKGPSPVALGKSGEYAILAKAGISNTGTTAVIGNIGVSPAAASFITGFSLAGPPSAYATSSLVTGQVFASDYASPTPAYLTTGVLDMLTAFTDAAGRAPDYIELGAGEIGGRTLAPATYKWGTDLLITTNVTLAGGPNDVWIFQIAGNLVLSSGVKVILSGGALAKNIFWQVAGAASHGTTTHFEGVELSKTAITLKTGASANGRLLAQTAVALDANAVSAPAP